jgi:hypothetical protein
MMDATKDPELLRRVAPVHTDQATSMSQRGLLWPVWPGAGECDVVENRTEIKLGIDTLLFSPGSLLGR